MTDLKVSGLVCVRRYIPMLVVWIISLALLQQCMTDYKVDYLVSSANYD